MPLEDIVNQLTSLNMQEANVLPAYDVLLEELHSLVNAWQELDEMHVDYYHGARFTTDETLRIIYCDAMSQVVSEKLKMDNMILEILVMMTQAQQNEQNQADALSEE